MSDAAAAPPVVEGEAYEEPPVPAGAGPAQVQALARYDGGPPATVLGGDSPAARLASATEYADTLKDALKQRNMLQGIQGREHVKVEGWQTLGALTGVFPVVVECAPCGWISYEVKEVRHKKSGGKIVETTERTYTVEGNDWRAKVEARTLDGRLVGSGVAFCKRSESTWAERDDYALASMAQTRATSKAMKTPLGFIVHLAGYSATPAEEIPGSANEDAAKFGPAASEDQVAQAVASLTNLLTDDKAEPRSELALQTWAEFCKWAGEYPPQVAAAAFVKASTVLDKARAQSSASPEQVKDEQDAAAEEPGADESAEGPHTTTQEG